MSTKDVTKYFVYTKLTPIRFYPSDRAIIRIKCELYANGAAIELDYTMRHDNGHRGLLMSPEEYELKSPGEPFVIPVHPGAWPPSNYGHPKSADYIHTGSSERIISV